VSTSDILACVVTPVPRANTSHAMTLQRQHRRPAKCVRPVWRVHPCARLRTLWQQQVGAERRLTRLQQPGHSNQRLSGALASCTLSVLLCGVSCVHRELAVGPVAVTSLLISASLKNLVPGSAGITNPVSCSARGCLEGALQLPMGVVPLPTRAPLRALTHSVPATRVCLALASTWHAGQPFPRTRE
jgi:hypothetical protein